MDKVWVACQLSSAVTLCVAFVLPYASGRNQRVGNSTVRPDQAFPMATHSISLAWLPFVTWTHHDVPASTTPSPFAHSNYTSIATADCLTFRPRLSKPISSSTHPLAPLPFNLSYRDSCLTSLHIIRLRRSTESSVALPTSPESFTRCLTRHR